MIDLLNWISSHPDSAGALGTFLFLFCWIAVPSMIEARRSRDDGR